MSVLRMSVKLIPRLASTGPAVNTTAKHILLVTGMYGAGKTTVLRTLEDLGWEVVDNLPILLVDRLLATALPDGAGQNERPLALGFGANTRGFDAEQIVSMSG